MSVKELEVPNFSTIYGSELWNMCMQVPGITLMKDVSLLKGKFQEGERAIYKIQDFQVSAATM